MKKLYALLAFIILIVSPVLAQKKFTASAVTRNTQRSLDTHFANYSLFNIQTGDIAAFTAQNKGAQSNFELELPGLGSFKLSLTEHDILDPNYTLTVNSGSERVTYPRPANCITYWGTLIDQPNSGVSLTIDNDIIYGMIEVAGAEFFIEPLTYFDRQSAPDVFVVYRASDLIPDSPLKCGVTEMTEHQPGTGRIEAGLTCVRTQISIASDASMFTRYGSASAVQTHNIGVMNNVIWDYVNNQFNYNIEFQILTQNVSTTVANDQLTPAYTGTDCDVILPNFRTWGNAGGFGSTAHDIGQFWSTRNFDDDGAGNNSGIIGLAYVGVVCGASRYQILEDFVGSVPTGSGYQLRVLTSHETGHNFGCSHDGAGTPYIMAPSVQNTSLWSPASVSTVDANAPGYACLTTCATAAPIINFITSPSAICTGGTITMIDHTLNGPTSWSWTTPGGSPTTSTARNPAITYASAGIKSVGLNASNGVGAGTPVVKNILVSAPPTSPVCANSAVNTTEAGIKSFSLNTISNVTGSSNVDGNEYMDFSCTQNTQLLAATQYTVSVQVGTTTPSNQFNEVRLFIDYNNDGDFIDANEAVYVSPLCYIGTHTFTFTTITSPPITNQFLRLRVLAGDCVGGNNSCTNVTNGQVEDYSVYFGDALLLSVSNIDFSGYHANGVNVLNWKTSGELNNNYFDVERSVDGISFSPIGRVSATGTTSNRYALNDPLLNGFATYPKLYYRLKTTELSGQIEYSKVVVITMKGGKDDLLLSVYPNPFRETMTATIQLGKASTVKAQLFDLAGKLVYQDTRKLLAGINTVNYSGFDKLASGTYMIKIVSDNGTVTRLVEKH